MVDCTIYIKIKLKAVNSRLYTVAQNDFNLCVTSLNESEQSADRCAHSPYSRGFLNMPNGETAGVMVTIHSVCVCWLRFVPRGAAGVTVPGEVSARGFGAALTAFAGSSRLVRAMSGRAGSMTPADGRSEGTRGRGLGMIMRGDGCDVGGRKWVGPTAATRASGGGGGWGGVLGMSCSGSLVVGAASSSMSTAGGAGSRAVSSVFTGSSGLVWMSSGRAGETMSFSNP